MLSRLLTPLLLLILPSLVAAAPGTSVLILHGAPSPTPWTDGVARGVAEETGDSGNVLREFLGDFIGDGERIDAYAEELRERLTEPVSMVIATDETAGAFAGKYRDEIFPKAAVVLTGPGRTDPNRLALCGDCAVLPLEADLEGTLELILSLRPETRLIVGLSDATPAGRSASAHLAQAVQQLDREIETLFPGNEPGDSDGLDLDTLAGVLAGMPSRSVAVLLRFREDNTGEPISEDRLFRLLRSRISTPVFVLTDAALGSGVVGGMLVTGRETGRRAVCLARRILAGEPAQEMLPEPVGAETVLDATALARFGMQPVPDATVVNTPQTPDGSDGIKPGFAPVAVAAAVAFAALLFLLRRYR